MKAVWFFLLSFIPFVVIEVMSQCTAKQCHLSQNNPDTCPNRKSLTDLSYLMVDLHNKQQSSLDVFETRLKSGFKVEALNAAHTNRILDLLGERLQKVERQLQKVINETSQPKPSSCWELKQSGTHISGVYAITVGIVERNLYCDMDTDQGGWTVFQRRRNGHVDFYRDWRSYADGFGSIFGEFWLGNDLIHQITTTEPQELRIDLEDFNGNRAYAKYTNFSIGPESDQYRLWHSGYSGTAGNSFAHNNQKQFSTKDRDYSQDSSGSCAHFRRGAWWYGSCSNSNLNGPWVNRKTLQAMYWNHWKTNYEGLKSSTMMMRPQSRG